MEKGEREVSFFWVEDSNEQMPFPMKPKRKVRQPKKMEFVGWGSKPLIEFLESIGKDSSKQPSQHEVTAIINEYVHKSNLIHPEKKKKIVCDERLHSLFGKKSVPRIKIYDLLEAHFAENHDSSEDDLLYSSEEQDDAILTSKRRKVEKKTTYQKKQVPETPKSCFAAITPENMNLLYLKRSLVQDLLKDPESFEGKVVGSYVRIKSDPNDYFQKNSHQLLPVTGVRKVPESGDVGKEVLLHVPNMIKDVPIHRLSDDDFSKEECEDLRRRVKDGLLKRPTVVELEQKARILHEDITKHWLPRELAFLQNLIERANEKGWRRELHEYLERKQLLQTPSEQTRLLLEIPKVIADELEPEAALPDPVQNVKEGNICSPTSILRDASNGSVDSGANQTLSSHSSDASGSRNAAIPSQITLSDLPIDRDSYGGFLNGTTGSRDAAILSQIALSDLPFDGDSNGGFLNGTTAIKASDEDQPTDPVQLKKENNGELKLVNSREAMGSLGIADKKVTQPQVIELSDDEEEVEDLGGRARIVDHREIAIWYYFDPQGNIQGPFPLMDLKRWYDAHYFHPSFMVWKRGQTPDHAVFLSDVLCQMFPKKP